MYSLHNKTVLITGATGLIGSHLVDELMVLGDVKIIALSRSQKKLEKGFADYLSDPNFTCLARDISQPLSIQERIDFIFHAAGPMEGKIIANSPLDVINPNLIGVQNCLELLHTQEAITGVRGRLVVFSSVTVYRNIGSSDLTVTETETAITETLDGGGAPYSQSKRMAEVIAQAYRKQYHVDVVIARFSTVYGDTRFRPDTAFFEFIKKAVAGEKIILNGEGMPRRDNIYIDDAVLALLAVAQNGVEGEAYNISSNGALGNYAAVDEIAQAIADASNLKFNRKPDECVKIFYKGGQRKPGLMLDNGKLQGLNWTLQTSLTQGIMNAVNTYVGSTESCT